MHLPSKLEGSGHFSGYAQIWANPQIEGALWFPAVDVARAIKANVAVISPNIKRTVDADEVRSLKFGDCPYQIYREIEPKANNLTLISESGLFKFILRAHPSNPAMPIYTPSNLHPSLYN